MIRAVVVLALLVGCAQKKSSDPTRTPIERLERALLGPGDECRRGSDCDSGVCVDGFCTPLVDAGQTWMERATGASVAALIEEDPAVRDLLLTELAVRFESEDPFTRGRFAGLLGAVGDPKAIPLLTDWAKSPVERVAVRSTLALGRLKDEAAFDRVLALLDHRSESVSLDALDAFVGYRDRFEADVLDVLTERLGDRRPRVRQRAIRLLGEVGTPRKDVFEALQAIGDDPGDGHLHYDVRRALTRLLD